MIIENRLKFCREKLELTQKELGTFFNLSDKTISNWENGYDNIPLEKLICFCNEYKFNIDFILNINMKITQSNKYVLNSKKIGENLKLYRNNFKLSQRKISYILGISQSCYSQYESGLNTPTTTFLYSFCKNFNTSIESIIS